MRLSRVCGYQELVNSFCKLGAELKSIVGKEGGWAFSTRDRIGHQHFAVPSSVNSVLETAVNISARRLKRSVKQRM